MTDLSQTIAPKSDQLNSDDLIGGPITVKITKVSACPNSAEQPIAINYEGDQGKPFKPCKSMRRVLVQVWGKDGNSYPGRAMTLYRDPAVQFGGLAVGGIRISHMSNIDSDVTMALTATRASRKPFTVKPLKNGAAHAPSSNGDRGKAEQWVTAYLASDRTETPAVQKTLAKLQRDHPDLYERATKPPVDDDYGAPAEEPETGRGNEQHGEGFNPASDEEVSDRLIQQVRGKELVKDIVVWESETKDDYDSLSPAWQDKVDEAIAARRAQLTAK